MEIKMQFENEELLICSYLKIYVEASMINGKDDSQTWRPEAGNCNRTKAPRRIYKF